MKESEAKRVQYELVPKFEQYGGLAMMSEQYGGESMTFKENRDDGNDNVFRVKGSNGNKSNHEAKVLKENENNKDGNDDDCMITQVVP